MTENVNLFSPVTDAAPPEMPQVQEHAIAAARERIREASPQDDAPSAPQEAPTPTESRQTVKGQTDEDGNPYDPIIHESPLRLNKSGYIAKRRGGAKKKNVETAYRSHAAPQDTPAPQEAQAAEVPDEVKIDATATLFCSMFIGTAQMVGGEDFAPEKGEENFIKSALVTYFRESGVIDVPPSFGVAMAFGMYVAKRWNRPGFAERRQGWTQRLRLWTAERFGL